MEQIPVGAVATWGWIVLGLLLVAVELLFGAVLPLAAAGAAVLVGAVGWVWPGIPFAGQAGLFVALTAVFWAASRQLPAVRQRLAQQAAALAAAEQMVGREAEVIAFDFHEGTILIDGARWPARLDSALSRTPARGDRMRVIATDGKVVWVRPI